MMAPLRADAQGDSFDILLLSWSLGAAVIKKGERIAPGVNIRTGRHRHEGAHLQ